MSKPVGKKKRSDEEAAAAAAAETLRKIESAALGFKALGDPTRLRIVLFLRASAGATTAPFDKNVREPLGDEAEASDPTSTVITVGAVALHLTGSDKVSSNISHHLKELRHAGLIAMKRRGKNILCRVEPSALETLENLLCCRDEMLHPVLLAGAEPAASASGDPATSPAPAPRTTPKKRSVSPPEVTE